MIVTENVYRQEETGIGDGKSRKRGVTVTVCTWSAELLPYVAQANCSFQLL